MDIKKIAEGINNLSKDYKISSLQERRKILQNLKRVPTQKIFSNQTIFERYAFHAGARGRKELQFNIGIEDIQNPKKIRFRYGVAFSLETSRTLSDISPFEPLIQRYNEYIRKNCEKYSDLKLWYYTDINDVRKRFDVKGEPIIDGSLFKVNNFIFLGKEANPENYSLHEILSLFDRLFPVYEYVEGSHCIDESIDKQTVGFLFIPGFSSKKKLSKRNISARKFEIEQRHNILQKQLFDILSDKYGKVNVGTEISTGSGTHIDVVVRQKDKYWFYEIKTASSLKACFREAISQLLEYSYWPGGQRADRLIIVAEYEIDDASKTYMSMLRNKLKIPIFYQQIVYNRNKGVTY